VTGTVWVDGQAVPAWRLRACVLVALHGPRCPGCADLARELCRRAGMWERWGVRVLVLREDAEPFPGQVPQAQDPGGRTRRTWAPGVDAFLAVVDRRGVEAGRWAWDHPRAPDWFQVDEAVRWVGTQEPECGTCVVEPAWEPRYTEEAVWKST